MTTFYQIHKRKIILGGVFGLLFLGFKMMGHKTPATIEVEPGETEEIVVAERQASVIQFGGWSPTEFRTVLGQVNSDADIDVKAELNGTIASVTAEVGDKVQAGEVLARFKTSNDPSAINYQSALRNLETTQLSTQNSIRSAEINVENARKLLEQTIAQQDQSYEQAYEALRIEAQAVKTTIVLALDTIDRMVQFTNKYRYNQDFSYAQIGNSDSIRRQNIKNLANQIAQQVNALQAVSPSAADTQVVQDARKRLQIMTSLQNIYDDLEILIERTSINSQISQTQVSTYIATVEGVHASLDARVSAYQGLIDRAEAAREQSRLAIIGAQNGLESAEAELELTRSQAEAQIVRARNQVNIAGASTADLVVRAPISGTVTDKTVRVGDFVNPGTVLFNIVNEEQDKKVVAFLNQDERLQAQKAAKIEVEIDGQIVPVTDRFLSSQIDAQTQKSLAEFTIPAQTALVGNLATVRIPIGSSVEGKSNLIPFSAVSFEPDGAEVLVLDADNVAQRQKIVVGRVVVSNIEVVSGLDLNQNVVEYYKRVLPGERVLADNIVLNEVEIEAITTEAEETEAVSLNTESTNE